MRTPPPELVALLQETARRRNVPYTLLAALAWTESKYDPAAIGPVTPQGWQARGLFQLGPKALERYKVSTPLDAAENARAAGEFLSHLWKGTDYSVPRTLAAWVWGPAKMLEADREKKKWPGNVTAFVDNVQRARRALQNEASTAGGTAVERMNNAITRLAFLNANDERVTKLNDAWVKWFVGERRLYADVVILTQPVVLRALQEYAIAYDRAAITDSTTPPPWMLAPDAYREIADKLERGAVDVAEVAKSAARAAKGAAEKLGVGVGWGLATCLGLWVLARGRRRSV